MFTRDQISFSASKPHGLSVYPELDECNKRLIAKMASEGLLEIRTKTVTLPALTGVVREHAKCFGFPVDEREHTSTTAHLTEAGILAWTRGAF